ncbi:conserved hypothetical protein [Lebetimonas natsushimae]|uniref:DUF4010 domain-containing protein n=1 Tax=Lebetimonas natsushimae TaxID=1936991 RepID=A0A292YDE9_9BACT|nr:DUF4010 domain-containing protein [Lebetimonas natsushimae]GAX87439.1 conserved hypothetical protein [Lebetimonas natsushimae]
MIPLDLLYFLIVLVFSFLTGLELKTYRISKGIQKPHFGSTRTSTFIGILGFVFYKININLYILGFFSITLLYAIHYYFKNQNLRTSILSFLIISLVYSYSGILFKTNNIWIVAIIFVSIVFILNYKSHAKNIFSQINQTEIETFGKFILLSAVILPVLPKTPIKFLEISPFKIWLIVVIISSISYFSYIAQKFLFKNKSFLITGIFGGLYSSTATTVVLAKKAFSINANENILNIINSSIILATSMMYIRILVIAFIFNQTVFYNLFVPFLIFSLIGIIISLLLYKSESTIQAPIDDRNPLELGTAFVFALLFILMILITKFVTLNYGNIGLKILSFTVGFTDIDPFILSLLTGKFSVTINEIASAIIIAAGSNNILKAIYSYIFSKKITLKASLFLIFLGFINIIYGLII